MVQMLEVERSNADKSVDTPIRTGSSKLMLKKPKKKVKKKPKDQTIRNSMLVPHIFQNAQD